MAIAMPSLIFKHKDTETQRFIKFLCVFVHLCLKNNDVVAVATPLLLPPNKVRGKTRYIKFRFGVK